MKLAKFWMPAVLLYDSVLGFNVQKPLQSSCSDGAIRTDSSIQFPKDCSTISSLAAAPSHGNERTGRILPMHSPADGQMRLARRGEGRKEVASSTKSSTPINGANRDQDRTMLEKSASAGSIQQHDNRNRIQPRATEDEADDAETGCILTCGAIRSFSKDRCKALNDKAAGFLDKVENAVKKRSNTATTVLTGGVVGTAILTGFVLLGTLLSQHQANQISVIGSVHQQEMAKLTNYQAQLMTATAIHDGVLTPDGNNVMGREPGHIVAPLSSFGYPIYPVQASNIGALSNVQYAQGAPEFNQYVGSTWRAQHARKLLSQGSKAEQKAPCTKASLQKIQTTGRVLRKLKMQTGYEGVGTAQHSLRSICATLEQLTKATQFFSGKANSLHTSGRPSHGGKRQLEKEARLDSASSTGKDHGRT